MLTCALELGPDPWVRLSGGPVGGTASFWGNPALAMTASIRGAHSRKFPKRSLQLVFPGELLIDPPPAGHRVRRIHLNADYVDPTLMRSALSFDLFREMGVPAPLSRHTSVQINGKPAGVYVALESVDRDFARRRGWAPGQFFYAVNRNANFSLISPFTQTMKERLDAGYQRVGKADPEPLRTMIADLNMASDSEFPAAAEQWFDTEGYLRWLMVAVFVGNRDGFMHNYALYLGRDDGRFRIIPWDYDATWGIDIHGRPARLDRVPVTGWNALSRRLLNTPHYRKRYRSTLLAALDGPLSPTEVGCRIDKMRSALSPWGDKILQERIGEGDFHAEVDRLKKWASDRRDLLLYQLADR